MYTTVHIELCLQFLRSFVLGEAGHPARMTDMVEHLAGDQQPWLLFQ